MSRKKRIDFFLPGGRNFLNGDKPDQTTLQNFADSMCFPKEVGDRAKLTEAGLSKITTDVRINDRVDTDAIGISPLGFPTFLKPAQLPNFISNDVEITITRVARTGSSPGYATAPDILDYEFSIESSHPFIPEDTDDIDWNVTFDSGATPAFIRYANEWNSSLCGVVLIDTPLPVGIPLSIALQAMLAENNKTVEVIKNLGDEICALKSKATALEVLTATTIYRFTASDMLNSAKLSNNTDNPNGNEHKPHLTIKNNTVTLHGVILVPNTIANDTDVMKIPRQFLSTLTSGITPTGVDRQFIVEYAGLPGRVGVKMGNIGGGASPSDWGALNFQDCKVEAATGVTYDEVLNGYRRLSLNGITFNITDI